MASTFTPNIQWEEPARGDDVGTWDTPVNNNGTLIDLVTGSIATIGLNNSNVVLSNAQFRSENITFNSTLTGSVTITFPTSFTKPYTIGNFCTGSSAFVITLATTAAAGEQIAVPPGQFCDVLNDGTNLRFKNLPHVGSYWDYAGSSVPLWVTTCTKQPWLPCDGSPFSAATYPTLAVILNSTTTPDSRGRAGIALDAGAGRVSSAVSGVAGNTRFAGGGDQSLQSHTHGYNDPGHKHNITGPLITGAVTQAGGSQLVNYTGGSAWGQQTDTAFIGITIVSAGAGAAQNMPPVLVYGIRMIRAG